MRTVDAREITVCPLYYRGDLRTRVMSPHQEEDVMVLILIDTNTGERRMIMVPVRKGPEPTFTAAVLTHTRFAARP